MKPRVSFSSERFSAANSVYNLMVRWVTGVCSGLLRFACGFLRYEEFHYRRRQAGLGYNQVQTGRRQSGWVGTRAPGQPSLFIPLQFNSI